MASFNSSKNIESRRNRNLAMDPTGTVKPVCMDWRKTSSSV